jgi:hypothetical protein
LAPTKRDGVWSSRMGVAHHGAESVFGSMLGWGEPLGIAMKALPTALEGAGAMQSGQTEFPDGRNSTLV